MIRKTSLLLFILLVTFSIRAQTSDTLVVGYNISPPFVTQKNNALHGPSYWLWEQIASEHDIPFVMKELPLDSLLEGLASGKIDVSGSPLTINSNRLEKIDFSAPYYIAHSSVLTPEVSAAEQAISFLGSFFSINFFRALGALAFVILIFGFLEWYFERKHNPDEFGKGIKGLWSGFWWSAVTMTTVGYGDKSPRSVGGRIIALVWMFTAIIIISGFTASIASSLTVNRMGSTQNNIQDFKDKRLGTVEKSGTDKWLKDNFFTNKVTYSDMEQLTVALEQKEIDAIAYDRPILQNLIKNDTLSRFSLPDITYNPQFYGFGLNRELPEELKQKISISVLENTESMDWKVLLSEYDLE